MEVCYLRSSSKIFFNQKFRGMFLKFYSSDLLPHQLCNENTNRFAAVMNWTAHQADANTHSSLRTTGTDMWHLAFPLLTVPKPCCGCFVCCRCSVYCGVSILFYSSRVVPTFPSPPQALHCGNSVPVTAPPGPTRASGRIHMARMWKMLHRIAFLSLTFSFLSICGQLSSYGYTPHFYVSQNHNCDNRDSSSQWPWQLW